jgi:hypothetical protein
MEKSAEDEDREDGLPSRKRDGVADGGGRVAQQVNLIDTHLCWVLILAQ